MSSERSLRERESVRGYVPLLLGVLYTIDQPDALELPAWGCHEYDLADALAELER